MSIFKKLFGGGDGGGSGGEPKAVAETTHKGYQILSVPMPENGQFRVCALIRKEIDGEVREHKLIRADVCSNVDEASEISIRKSVQIIDERGDRVFDI